MDVRLILLCSSSVTVGSGETPGSKEAATACCVQLDASVAKASTTEEPDAVIPHVRVCGGGVRYRAFLLREAKRSNACTTLK